MSYFYWTDKVDDYVVKDVDEQVLDIKRLNFFIGKNNSGKSRFCRALCVEDKDPSLFRVDDSLGLCDFHDYFSSELKKRRIGRTAKNGDNPVSINMISGLPYMSVKADADPNLNCDFMLSKITAFEMENKLNGFCSTIEDYFDLKNEGWIKDQIKIIGNLVLKKENVLKYKCYVPVLRGLRPISGDKNCYSLRTQKDYFNGEPVSGGIITGEEVYSFLRSCLLGEPEQRELIQNYEDLLSQYFFEGQKVALIPKHDSDVVHIKIGDDKQFPIYQLGDGLQQAIILTYQCYLQKDSVCAFFIEEPELHMHAGMLRQLMNFYLNETKHYYFFTTHSNHLLDMVDESDEVVIQKFTKKKKDDGSPYFEIKRCDKDRELLAALGVRPSSVYLANCTIWVEGITDRLYLVKYMQKYLQDLKNSNDPRFLKYRGFMPNFHYTFVEYQGSNLVHWSFDEEDRDFLDTQGLNALSVCSDMLLIADGDIQGKGSRVADLQTALGEERFYLLPCKETENTLPPDFLFNLAMEKFNRMEGETKIGFDGTKIKVVYDTGKINIFSNSMLGVGRIFDNLMRDDPPLKKADGKYKAAFAVDSGTVKDKVKFCREMLKKMDDLSAWELTDEAKLLCEKIFTFIESRNQDMLKPQDQ